MMAMELRPFKVCFLNMILNRRSRNESKAYIRKWRSIEGKAFGYLKECVGE